MQFCFFFREGLVWDYAKKNIGLVDKTAFISDGLISCSYFVLEL